MVEQNSNPTPEIIQIPRTIMFEGGIHSLSADRDKQMLAQILNGNLTKHFWAPNIAQRMAVYSPKIVAIDSELPSYISSEDWLHPEKVQDERIDIWYSLPARPQDFSPRQESIYVVRGDINFPYLITPDITADFDSYKQAVLSIDYSQRALYREETSNAAIKDIFKAFTGITATQVLWLTELCKMKSLSLTRRQFLRGLILGMGLGAFTIPLIGSAEIETSNHTMHNLYRLTTQLCDPYVIPRTIVDGRTALLVAKQLDAMNILELDGSDTGSLVLGEGHAFRASSFLHNSTQRNAAISKLGELIIQLMDSVNQEYSLANPTKLRQMVLDNFVATEVVQVRDPGGPNFNPNLVSLFPDTIRYTASFQSQRVEAAIAHLR